MLSKLLYLIALILFIAMAAFNPDNPDLPWWGFACIAGGLLLEGVGPVTPVFTRRTD